MFPVSDKHIVSMASQITCVLYLTSTSFLWPVRSHVFSISQTPHLYGQSYYMFPLPHMHIVSMASQIHVSFISEAHRLYDKRLYVSSISQAHRLYDQSDYMSPLSHNHIVSMASQITCFLYLTNTSSL